MKVAHLSFLEKPAYLMRIGGEGWSFGEPYEIVCTVLDLGDKRCEIRGLDKPMLPSHWRAAGRCLSEAGFEEAVFERHHADGTVEWRTARFRRSAG